MPDTETQTDPAIPDTADPEVGARRIYLMKDLPPEVIAVAFAKTSRSPDPFDKIADELTETGSARFHEKWVVGYGHASVAEHAILSIAVENVSIVAAKAIEDNRLASYTEKSTRYQIYDPEHVYRPASFQTDPEASSAFEELVSRLLTTYIDWSRQAIGWLRQSIPQHENEKDRAYTARLRAKACDAIRYLLPTATLTNLGWTVNARALAAAIRKLTGSPMPELREIGAEIRTAAFERVPTLLKYADPDEARIASAAAVSERLPDTKTDRLTGSLPPEVRLLRYDRSALRRLSCAVSYSEQHEDWDRLSKRIGGLSDEEMIALIRAAVAPLGPHDPMPRAFEHLNYLFEITIDYGAWRDIQRHRIGTQTAQDLSPNIGWTTPTMIEQMGLGGEFAELLEQSAAVYDLLRRRFPAEALYALMLAYRKRSLFAWNLREVCHFVKLRGTTRGHAAYRRVARDVWRRVLDVHPWLAGIVSPLGEDFEHTSAPVK